MRRQWPWIVVTTFVIVGLILVAVGAWRAGAVTIGAGMVAAGIFRSVLDQAGILQIRNHRWIDLGFYYILGIAIIVSALLVPGLH